MKKVAILCLMCVLSLSAAAQKVAQKYIPDKSKPVLLVFTADWCAPCQAMKQNVFSVDSVASALSGYNILMVDIDTPTGAAYQERFCRKEVQIPYFVVVDRGGAIRNRHLGAMQAGEFMSFLRDSGTLGSGNAGGAVKYVNVPDREDFEKGWEFEAGAGGAMVTTSEDKLFKPGVVISTGARYRKSHLVAFRMGLDGLYTLKSIDYIPRISIAVPADMELYLLDPAYISLGAFMAVNSAKSVKVAPDVGVRVGAGCKIWNLDVSFHYNVGVLNLNKGDIVNRVSASALTLTVGYCF
ncbi:MAG: thioredoxin family protein [Bacteroidales bacterium]|nr:thioredoxin family protein [Bacteroidales bacterium]